jgi:hypothetical protein
MKRACPAADEALLLEQARRGDRRAYGDLVDGHRNELHAHC